MLPIKPNDIHLWFAFPDTIQDVALLNRYKALLTPDERARQQRFYFPEHRHQYLITRALVRTTLARYVNTSPEQLRFTRNQYGRPEMIEPQTLPLRFNLSNTAGLILCGVVLQNDIGVDVEKLNRERTPEKIGSSYFSPLEVADLHRMDAEKRQDRFFQYWTLKESYIKARGLGLSLSLDLFTFHLPDDDESLRLSFAPCLQETPEQWHCWLFQPTAQHYAALSVRRAANSSSSLSIKKVVPLSEEQDCTCQILYNTAPQPLSEPEW